jgi:hypothetical protein
VLLVLEKPSEVYLSVPAPEIAAALVELMSQLLRVTIVPVPTEIAVPELAANVQLDANAVALPAVVQHVVFVLVVSILQEKADRLPVEEVDIGKSNSEFSKSTKPVEVEEAVVDDPVLLRSLEIIFKIPEEELV